MQDANLLLKKAEDLIGAGKLLEGLNCLKQTSKNLPAESTLWPKVHRLLTTIQLADTLAEAEHVQEKTIRSKLCP